VGAAAAACSLRFISVKGPELLNKYIGASEQAVRGQLNLSLLLFSVYQFIDFFFFLMFLNISCSHDFSNLCNLSVFIF
jgi:hypothetical protein